MKNYPRKSTIAFLLASVALGATACSSPRETQKETQDDLNKSVALPTAWHNQPGKVPAAKQAPAELTEAQRKAFNDTLARDASEAQRDRTVLFAWVRQFNDPVLERIITDALYKSPDLRTMLGRVTEMRARAGLESANLWPTIHGYLDARQNYRRDHRGQTTSEGYYRPGHHTTSGDLYTAGFAATWEIDLFGKYQSSAAAARMEEFVSIDNFRAAQISLVAEIAEAYIALRGAECRKDVALRNLDSCAESHRLAQLRQETGVGDTFELQQAATTLEQAKITVPALQGEIEQARTRLAVLTGAVPGVLDSMLEKKAAPRGNFNQASAADAALASLPLVPENLRIGAPGYVLSRRPDIRAARKTAVAAALRTKSAKRAWFPTLNLSGSIGIEALKAGNLFSPEATIGSILAGLTQPVFDGWRISKNIDITTEIQKQAMSEYESAVLNALGEVEEAFVAIRAASERLESLKRATNIAADNARIAAQRKESGVSDYGDVLENERGKLALEDQTVAVAVARATAQVRLFRVLGGPELLLDPVEGTPGR
ncbi:MAG: TolC family protein [Puniceicoccales bacterium]|nr:TolC family protein [Puniceicoccales bacterium]